MPEVLVGVGGRPTEGEGVHPVEQRAVVLAAGSGGSDRRDHIRPTAGSRRQAGLEQGGPVAEASALRLGQPQHAPQATPRPDRVPELRGPQAVRDESRSRGVAVRRGGERRRGAPGRIGQQ